MNLLRKFTANHGFGNKRDNRHFHSISADPDLIEKVCARSWENE